MGKGIKKTRKILIILFVVLIAGPGLTYLVLRNSKVQTFMVQGVAAYLSNQLDTKVEVGGLDISFFLHVVLQDVTVEDKSGNPLITTRRMVFDIKRISFRHRYLSINKLYLEEAYLGLARYPGEETFNFMFLLDYFSDDDRDKEKTFGNWDVVCRSLEITDAHFLHNDADQPPKEYGFDANHFELTDLNLVVNELFVEDQALNFNLEHLAFNESRGFQLASLSGWFSVNRQQLSGEKIQIKSAGSELSLDMAFAYDGYEAFTKFFEDVDLSLTLHESTIDLFDIGFYLPNLYGIQNKVFLSGRFDGKLSDFNGTDIVMSYGKHTSFKGDVTIGGLPAVSNARVNFHINEMTTSITDIQGFRMPQASKMSYIVLPENTLNLDKLAFQGSITGSINDLVALGKLQTSLGDFNTNLALRNNHSASQYSYSGQISTEEFALGRFLGNDNKLGNVGLDLEVEGEGLALETMEVAITGGINTLYLADYEYKNIDVTGNVSNRKFNGALLLDDQNIFLDFLGIINFEEDIPVFDFRATAANANLTALNLYQRTEEAETVVSAQFNINARGGSLDDLEGELEISDIALEERFFDQEAEPESVVYHTEYIGVVNSIQPGNFKILQLESDYIDAKITGHINFDRLGSTLRRFLYTQIPAFDTGNDVDQNPTQNSDDDTFAQNLDLEVHFKHTELLSDLFIPSVRLADNSKIIADFDSDAQQLNVTAHSDMLTLFGNRFVDWTLDGSKLAEGYQITNQSSRLLFSDSLFVEDFSLDGMVYNDTLMYESVWGTLNSEDSQHGHIQGLTQFVDDKYAIHRFLPSYAMINNSKWQINIDNEVLFDSARVEINNLVFYNDEQLVNINGVLSPDSRDRMHAYFHDFQFSNLDGLIRLKKMNFGGVVNGMLSFTTLFQPASFEADIGIGKFEFNDVHLGDLSVYSEWLDPLDAFQVETTIDNPDLNGEGKILEASGFIYTKRGTDNFDLDIQVDNLPLSIWSRYLEGFAQDFHGLASGALRLTGPSRKPGLSGLLEAHEAGFRIDYLKTAYTFSHQIRIEKNEFSFNKLMLVDSLGNTGLSDGTIRHETFKNFSMDIRIRPEQMVILNTNSSDNRLYYGKAFASGLLHIYGTQDDITMDISASTNRGTQIFLPLSYSGEVVENNFITFVSKDTTFTNVQIPDNKVAGITLNFDLDVSPEAEVQLIFDSQIGDIIRGRGAGNLRLEITPQGAFSMYGEYIIQEGDYLFTLQNIINKRFRIEQGGAIRWTGDPNDADIDLQASYRLRTTLYDLMMDMDTTDMYQRRVPVECVLILEESLMNPKISFDIHLPGGDEGTRELIERRITTEQEMNRQVFSLLVLNRFLPATTDQYNTALGYGVGSTSSELLSNQLSNWLSQISSEFDIGINYRPGDQISSQELEVALSTQLFDDRVIIDGNFGVAGSNPSVNQKTSNIIGDIIVEVKLTPEGRFRIKAFNRSNTLDIINANSPYTQGVGVFYRKEFDSILELFKRSYRPEEGLPMTE